MAIIMDFTIEDYKAAVDRELTKRLTTYPRIIAKMYKKERAADDISIAKNAQIVQMYNLQNVRFCLEQEFLPDEPTIFGDMLAELKREFKMRQKHYPRWIWFHSKSDGKSGISQETATQELAVWKSLILHFENQTKNGTGI